VEENTLMLIFDRLCCQRAR